MTDTLTRPANELLTGRAYRPELDEPGASSLSPWSEPAPALRVPQHLWPVAARVLELLELPANWDSYGASHVSSRAARRALVLLLDHGYRGPLPAVSPTVRGGVHLEWSNGADGVEIEVEPGGALDVLIDVGGEMVEATTTDPDHGLLLRALSWARQH